jgi:hypothetical protein
MPGTPNDPRPLALDPFKYHVDWYDQMFDRRGEGVPVWKRNTRDDFPPRQKQFEILREGHHFDVPEHGRKRPERYWESQPEGYDPLYDPGFCGPQEPHGGGDAEVVAYLDETMHQGMGKERMRFADVPMGAFWARYVPTPDGRGHSRRWLTIGHRWFAVLEYESDDWRSNHQTTDVRVLCVRDVSKPHGDNFLNWMTSIMVKLKSPLLAIDATKDAQGRYWATDLNLAPGFEACLHDSLTSTQVVDAIKEFWYRHCREGR